jgi:hypothetical protein
MTIAYRNPRHKGNGKSHHTGKLCIEGCGRPAGTAWSPYWCFKCNVIRMDRISAGLQEIAKGFSSGEPKP